MGWGGAGVLIRPLLSQDVSVTRLNLLPHILCCRSHDCMRHCLLAKQSLAVLLGNLCQSSERSAAVRELTHESLVHSAEHGQAVMEALESFRSVLCEASAGARRYVMKEGDMPVEEWTEKEAAGEIAAEYEVDALVAEQGQGERRTFLVKWKVRPGHLCPLSSLSDIHD